jgi:GNAT superfamily N-acetyltransferase
VTLAEKVVVSTPGITFEILDGRHAAAHAEELQALHDEVPDQADDAALFAGQFRVRLRQPGFVLAEARHGDYLVGYASGMPLRPATSWWKHLTTPVSVDVTTEHAGRTFALTELLVCPSWRRQGIAAELHDLVLGGRPEERATAVVPTAAAPAQSALRAWGWSKVARSRGPHPHSSVLDVFVVALASGKP